MYLHPKIHACMYLCIIHTFGCNWFEVVHAHCSCAVRSINPGAYCYEEILKEVTILEQDWFKDNQGLRQSCQVQDQVQSRGVRLSTTVLRVRGQ